MSLVIILRLSLAKGNLLTYACSLGHRSLASIVRRQSLWSLFGKHIFQNQTPHRCSFHGYYRGPPNHLDTLKTQGQGGVNAQWRQGRGSGRKEEVRSAAQFMVFRWCWQSSRSVRQWTEYKATCPLRFVVPLKSTPCIVFFIITFSLVFTKAVVRDPPEHFKEQLLCLSYAHTLGISFGDFFFPPT